MLPYPKTVIALSKEARAAVDKAMASRGETWDTYSSRGTAPHVVSEDVVKQAEGMVADSRRLSRLGTGETTEKSKLLGRSVMNTAVGSQMADLDIALDLFASRDERSEMRRRLLLDAGQARPAPGFRRDPRQARPAPGFRRDSLQAHERAEIEAMQRREVDKAGPPDPGDHSAYRAAPSAVSYGLMSREWPYYPAGPASKVAAGGEEPPVIPKADTSKKNWDGIVTRDGTPADKNDSGGEEPWVALWPPVIPKADTSKKNWDGIVTRDGTPADKIAKVEALNAKGAFDTKLTPSEEAKFKVWKQRYAPNDSGMDYDLRGAFRAGEKPGPDGHWTDKFKKPNHPTFSDQSQYARGEFKSLAGTWKGDKFIPAGPASRETPRAIPYRLPAPVNGVPVMFASDKARREWLEDLEARRRASFEQWHRRVKRGSAGSAD